MENGIGWLVSVDGRIISQEISTPLVAMAIYFATYFVFGVEYATGVAATLDFIQRYVCLPVSP